MANTPTTPRHISPPPFRLGGEIRGQNCKGTKHAHERRQRNIHHRANTLAYRTQCEVSSPQYQTYQCYVPVVVVLGALGFLS